MIFPLAIKAKYDLKVHRQIGISFTKEGQEILIDFALLDWPWKYDLELEHSLKKNNPFSPMTGIVRHGYQNE